ncbi:MAG TPA: hypothetical protein VFC51_17910 [Chloroflexota bacterium]|nr:hypothetical protein [Chloroflexota bacterium]
MGAVHVTVTLAGFAGSPETYEALFPVDTGATDCRAPASALQQIGVAPIARSADRLRSR